MEYSDFEALSTKIEKEVRMESSFGMYGLSATMELGGDRFQWKIGGIVLMVPKENGRYGVSNGLKSTEL